MAVLWLASYQSAFYYKKDLLLIGHKCKDTTQILHIKLGYTSYFLSVMNIQITKNKLFLRNSCILRQFPLNTYLLEM